MDIWILNFSVLNSFAEAVRLHGSRLTDYERQEIDKYQEIWFLGLDACKINAKPGTALNSGYDDDNGSYNKVNFIASLIIYRVCTSLARWLNGESFVTTAKQRLLSI